MMLAVIHSPVEAAEQDAEAGVSAETGHQPVFTRPRLLRSPASGVYPSKALAENREGLVYLRFDLDETGKPSNVTVEDEGFQVETFGPSARKWLAGARFEPVKKDGVPMALPGLRMPMRFQIRDTEPGIKQDFRNEMNKVVKLLDDRDFAGAHFHAQWMLSEKAMLLYEYAVLEATLANTLARTGEIHAALQATRSTTTPSSMRMDPYRIGGPTPEVGERDFLLPKQVVEQQLRLRFILAASQNLDGDALTAHAYLQGLGMVPDNDPTFPEYRKILSRVQNSPKVEGQVKVGESSTWKQDLVFRAFAIREVKGGSIKRVETACHGGFWASDDPAKFLEVVVQLPATSEACVLDINAAPGTQFRVVEYR